MSEAAPVDRFAGTAQYYARYRLPYPESVLDSIAAECGLDGSARVLDLGTGTGQVAIPLAARCREVVAADISAEMVAEGRREAERAGAANVRWLRLAAEAVTPALGTFRLVTMAQSFHWMDRDEVLRRMAPLLEPGGGLALLGMTTIWGAPEPFAEATVAVVRRWLGDGRRAGGSLHTSTNAHAHRPFEEILTDGGFGRLISTAQAFTHTWTVDAIVGYLYSTSYCSPALLDANRAAFEGDLRQTLLALDPAGRFAQAITVTCLLARPG